MFGDADALSESHHALSSQDGKINLMDYRPLLQLVRNGRQDYRFNRHAAVPVYHPEDDYGRTNEIPNTSVVAVSHGKFFTFEIYIWPEIHKYLKIIRDI